MWRIFLWPGHHSLGLAFWRGCWRRFLFPKNFHFCHSQQRRAGQPAGAFGCGTAGETQGKLAADGHWADEKKRDFPVPTDATARSLNLDTESCWAEGKAIVCLQVLLFTLCHSAVLNFFSCNYLFLVILLFKKKILETANLQLKTANIWCL